MPELPRDCWVPVPMRWRYVLAGDVFVSPSSGNLWTVALKASGPGGMIVSASLGSTMVDGQHVDPDDMVSVLVPATEADAVQLTREVLGARLIERRTA